ncbi:uncharacterized protein LOC124816031 [Hydra vulgaris]|uniref:uncharacterized protein LOC124816031 n=1 Tax=Hydra vulgaris TaxID=6087 RepID=UPI001F5EF329|nr:uncharacterized protein LOC124816035 [Hydra vulgaris]
MSKNGTQMTKHIEKCQKCPDEVKSLYANKSGYSQKQQDSPADAEQKTKNPQSDSFGTSFFESICRSKIPSSVFDSMTKTEKELIDTHLARAIYASGSPLHIVEYNYWKIFLNKLCPAYKLR